MARTTSTAVIAVLLDDYGPRGDGTLPDLTAFVETASAVVDDVEDCAAARDRTLGSTRLELIERWLAAHFYAVSDQPYRSKSTADASATFQGDTAMYFEATKYGQTAMRLDPSGCLAAIGGAAPARARAFWLGKPPSEQTDYEDRD